MESLDGLNGFTAVGSLPDEIDTGLGLEKVPNPFSDDRMVVGDQDPNSVCDWGTSSLTRVPWPGSQ